MFPFKSIPRQKCCEVITKTKKKLDLEMPVLLQKVQAMHKLVCASVLVQNT